jgi:hypothetical protein
VVVVVDPEAQEEHPVELLVIVPEDYTVADMVDMALPQAAGVLPVVVQCVLYGQETLAASQVPMLDHN